jgi:CubicO group peptidase (beta-lactamase class C family)
MRTDRTRPAGRTALKTRIGAAALAGTLAHLALAGLAIAREPTPEPQATQTLQVQTAADAIRDALSEIQQIPGAFPAVAAVVVHGEATPLMYVHGLARAGHPATVDRSSQFYIASQTKSFIALLAAHLDERGVLPLQTTLAQIWPQLTLPAPADPTRITMADLLSHQEPLRTDTLNLLTAYVRALPAAEYPAMLARYTEARAEGFRYSNLGDLIYGAALEVHTGRRWQAWLQQEVLQPLQLEHIYSRGSQAPAQSLTWNHQWDGEHWIATPPKPDALMHAAGGLFASTDDLARWMRANLRRQSPTGLPSPASFERAQRPLAQADLSDDEFVCDGYSLGWYSCVYAEQRVLMHPGSYRGVVSVTLLIPGIDAGLSLGVNSDSAIEGLALELMKAFIGLAHGHSTELARLRTAVTDYPGRLAQTVAARRNAVQTARDDASWGGWTWAPSPAESQPYLGEFESDRLGRITVIQTSDGLEARLGAMNLKLSPARVGLFGASTSPIDPPEAFLYADDLKTLQWRGDEFRRASADTGSTASGMTVEGGEQGSNRVSQAPHLRKPR